LERSSYHAGTPSETAIFRPHVRGHLLRLEHWNDWNGSKKMAFDNFTDSQIREIHRLKKSDWSVRQIVGKFDSSIGTISRILNPETDEQRGRIRRALSGQDNTAPHHFNEPQISKPAPPSLPSISESPPRDEYGRFLPQGKSTAMTVRGSQAAMTRRNEHAPENHTPSIRVCRYCRLPSVDDFSYCHSCHRFNQCSFCGSRNWRNNRCPDCGNFIS